MDQAERDQAQKLLMESREFLRQTLAGLSPERRSFRPAPDRWSIDECLEHIALVESSIFDAIQRVLQAPPPPERPGVLDKDRFIIEQGPQRTTRIQGPPRLMPTGRWPDCEQLTSQFEAARERTLEFAQSTEVDLRAYGFPHPVFGPLDCYQWVLLIAAHCQRHTHQMEEVMASAGFAAKAGSAEA